MRVVREAEADQEADHAEEVREQERDVVLVVFSSYLKVGPPIW